MASKKNTSIITVSIDEGVRDSLDKLGTKLDLSISKLARNLIYSTLDDYRLPEKFGLSIVSQRIFAFRSQCNALEKVQVEEGVIDVEQDLTAQISVVIDSEVKEYLENLSKILGLPTKVIARNFIYIGLRDINALKKVGVFQIALAFDSFIKTYFKLPDRKT